jgi:hypothetical protein
MHIKYPKITFWLDVSYFQHFLKKKKNRWDLCMVYESSCTNHSKKSFHGFSSLAHASTPILVNCGRPIFRGGGGYMLLEGDLVAIWGHCCLKAICCNLRTRLLVVDSIWTVSCNKHLWLSIGSNDYGDARLGLSLIIISLDVASIFVSHEPY